MRLSHESPTGRDVLGGRAPRRLPGAVPSAALATVLAVSVAQTATAAALPATTRVLGLADWQAGAVASATGVTVVLTGAAWGRRADRSGSRGVVLTAAAAGVLGVLGTAAVLATVAGVGSTSPGLAWAGLLLARGVLLGSAVAAVGPAVQALLVRGAEERERVAWIARGGAVRGLGTMLGAGLAAGLGAVGPSSVLPVVAAVAVLAGAAAVFAGVTRAGAGAGRHPARPDPAPGVARSGARVPAVRRALVASLAVFLATALVQGSIGFLVQDRHGVTAGRATASTGMLLLVAGLGSVLAQGVLVPRLRWSPWRLVHAGSAVVVVAVGGYAVPTPLPVLVAIALLFGAGVGAAAAGCTSAAATATARESQGDVAGMVHAVNALAFVLGPTLAAAGYGLHPVVPALGALAAASVALAVSARERP